MAVAFVLTVTLTLTHPRYACAAAAEGFLLTDPTGDGAVDTATACVSQGAQCATDKGELKLLMRSKLQAAVSDLTVVRKAPIIHARETPSSFPSHPSFMLGHASGQVGM